MFQHDKKCVQFFEGILNFIFIMPFLIFEAKKQIQLGCFEGKIKLAKKYGEKQTNKKTIKNKLENCYTGPGKNKKNTKKKNEKETKKEI
jgi:hypothetical protein